MDERATAAEPGKQDGQHQDPREPGDPNSRSSPERPPPLEPVTAAGIAEQESPADADADIEDDEYEPL